MNSQNRMNAGAEYVLYRIWAALQDQNGIHAASLLACVGALAGYACQVCVRQTAALPGVDPGKYALRAVENSDGTTYVYGDALNVPLTESPLSVWALVGRAVQKLGQPLPDIEDISRHVTQTVGTSAFGVPRVPEGPHPRLPPSVYLKQVWPQILPIAQRFCSKPMQIPVLFGIALQRAIEETKDMLSPTLSASIAMESAVAMSKVALPGADANPSVAVPAGVAMDGGAMPMQVSSPFQATAPLRASAPLQATASLQSSTTTPSSSASTSFHASAARKRRRTVEAEASTPAFIATLVAHLPRVPQSARILAIASVAFISVAGAMYKEDPDVAPIVAREVREVRQLVGQQVQESEPVQEEQFQEETGAPEQPMQLAQANIEQTSEEQPPPEEAVEQPGAEYQEPPDELMTAESQSTYDPTTDGSAEIVMRDDFGEGQT